MTPSGWVFIALVWGAVIGVTGWCYAKLLFTPDGKKSHGH